MVEPDKFHWRRIPGTAALAVTNLIAASLMLFGDAFEVADITSKSAAVAPASTWGGMFLLSAIFLIASIFNRKWVYLNIGSAISLFLWTFMVAQVAFAVLVGATDVSPIAFALLWWMWAGQVTMLFTPLWTRGRGSE